MTSPNPIGEGAREIAGKLTKAQREAIVGAFNAYQNEWVIGASANSATVKALAKRGLSARSSILLAPCLTDLGLAVRSLLASTQVTK